MKEREVVNMVDRAMETLLDNLNKLSINQKINESISNTRVIDSLKRKLIAKAKTSGFTENFGEREINQLKNKYGYNPYGTPEEREFAAKIQELENWCANVDLSSLDYM